MNRKTIGMIMGLGGLILSLMIPFNPVTFILMVVGLIIWWYD